MPIAFLFEKACKQVRSITVVLFIHLTGARSTLLLCELVRYNLLRVIRSTELDTIPDGKEQILQK